MADPTREFTVRDLPSLVAKTIRERLGLLDELQKVEALSGQVNKQASSERLELLSLALRASEICARYGGG